MNHNQRSFVSFHAMIKEHIQISTGTKELTSAGCKPNPCVFTLKDFAAADDDDERLISSHQDSMKTQLSNFLKRSDCPGLIS